MLKRFMTWLLNQFQKVISTLTKGSSKAGSPTEEERTPSAIANRLSSDINSQRQPDGNEPVALRGPFIPSEPANLDTPDAVNTAQAATSQTATSDSISSDVPISSGTEADTHQRLDVAPAALPGETITPPSFPTEVSELISAQTNKHQPDADLNPNQLQQVSKPAYQDDQPPEIHDLLPAIEPDEPEPNEEKTESPVETTPPEASVDITPVASASTTQSEPAIDTPIVESAERISNKEEITLFSFNITESDDNQENNTELAAVQTADTKASAPTVTESISEKTEEIQSSTTESQSLPEESVVEPKAQTSSEPATYLADSQQSDQSTTPVIEKRNQPTPEHPTTTQPKEPQAEPVDSAPENPWLTAVPAQSQTSSSESSPPSPEKEKTQKAGTVKLLFKLKPGNFHGYIAPHDGTKDILFHQKYINADIFDRIDRGSEVIATIKYLEGKVYATHVALP